MPSEVIVALCALAGTLGGSALGVLSANRLAMWRIEQLEKKVDRLGEVIERTAVLERDQRTAFGLLDEHRDRIRILEGAG